MNDDNPRCIRDLSAWYDVGRADGRQGREGLFPKWADPKVRSAWTAGYRAGVAEDLDYDPLN